MDNLRNDTTCRFVAFVAAPTTKQMMKHTYVFIAAAIALVGGLEAVAFLVGAVVGSETVMQLGGGVAFFSFLLLTMPAYAAFHRRMNRARLVDVRFGDDGVRIGTRPDDVFPCSETELGRWTVAGYPALTKGTVLHLRCGRHRFLLGGRDHRAAAGIALHARPVDGVDAWMWAADFDEVLAALGSGRYGQYSQGITAEPRELPELPEPSTRCLLVPNPMRLVSSSVLGMFKNTATALRLNANPPQPSVALDVGDDSVAVIDLKTDACTASAPLERVSATPAASTRSMPRSGPQTTPVLVVTVPDAQPMTIGCPDLAGPPQVSWRGGTSLTPRFRWRRSVPAEREPEFVVSDIDWLTLVGKLGLTADLEDRAVAAQDGDADVAPARPKTKRWVFAIVAVFAITPIIWVPALIVLNRQHQQADQLKLDRLRPFTLAFTDLHVPHGVAVDAAGNIYVADGRANRVVKLAAGVQTVLPFTGLDLSGGGADESTAGVAVDGAGNVYVTDSGHHRVLEMPAGSGIQLVLPFTGLDLPQGIAVDGSGTVYVADPDAGVLKLTVGSSRQTALSPTGKYVYPHEVAVGPTGTVYVRVHSGKHTNLLKLGADGWTTLPAPANPRFVAVDNADTVYVMTARGVRRSRGGVGDWTELPAAPGFLDPQGLAVDNRGNVYVTDHTGDQQSGTAFGIWTLPGDNSHGFVFRLPG